MMNKRLLALAAPAAALLLGACGGGQPTAGVAGTAEAKSSDTKTDAVRSGTDAPGTGDGRGDQIDNPDGPKIRPGTTCGPLDDTAAGRGYTVVTDDTPAGNPGCTVAFTVLDEYRKAPAGSADGSRRTKDLSHGWSCGTDGGSGSDAQGNIYCTTGKPDGRGGVTGGLAFHTERAA